jgi:hypothetical protein
MTVLDELAGPVGDERRPRGQLDITSWQFAKNSRMRIPTKPAGDSDLKPVAVPT